jgi:hypothetical protein
MTAMSERVAGKPLAEVVAGEQRVFVFVGGGGERSARLTVTVATIGVLLRVSEFCGNGSGVRGMFCDNCDRVSSSCPCR